MASARTPTLHGVGKNRHSKMFLFFGLIVIINIALFYHFLDNPVKSLVKGYRSAISGISSSTFDSSVRQCRMEDCFDFSRCSLVSGFPVFVYPPGKSPPMVDPVLMSAASVPMKRYVTHDPDTACVFVVLLGGATEGPVKKDELEHFLHSLPHWNGDGNNHVLISLANTNRSDSDLENVDTGRALVVQTAFLGRPFRQHFDVIIPPSRTTGSGETWSELPTLSPARRKYLVSFWGEYIPSLQSGSQSLHLDRRNAESMVIASLQSLHTTATDKSEMVNLSLSCGTTGPYGVETEWGLCGNPEQRKVRLSQSTFALLITPLDDSLALTVSFQTRLHETLKEGAVPVILGDAHGCLPFGEILRWEEAALTLPLPRLKELLMYLRAFGNNDILQLRQHGRFLWEKYFSSARNIVDTTLALLRTRLRLPAAPARDQPAVSVYSNSSVPLEPEIKAAAKESGKLSVLSIPSKAFLRNYSHSLTLRSFNSPGDPFSLFPYTPFEPVLPSEAKIWGRSCGTFCCRFSFS